MSLDPSAESTHIPYRDAKLTRILQNSLGKNKDNAKFHLNVVKISALWRNFSFFLFVLLNIHRLFNQLNYTAKVFLIISIIITVQILLLFLLSWSSTGGNSYTVVLAVIHPLNSYYEECLSTLQFANRCRNVMNNPKVNYIDDHVDKDVRIKKLTEEIGVLRNKMNLYEKSGGAGVEGKEGHMSASSLMKVLKKLGILVTIICNYYLYAFLI